MNLNLTVNEAACTPPPDCPATPGTFAVRAYYKSQQDGGHLYGTFSTRERAEQCVLTMAGRADVESAAVETA